MKLTQEELDKIVRSHGKWLRGEGGERANLYQADLWDVNLCRADLRGANLYKADLRRADLSRADLSRANLREAILCKANLKRADLRKANLYNAILCEANLYKADLRRADLRRADLHKADLYGADLDEKIIQIGPIGSRQDYTVYNATHDVVQCGCWNNYKGGTLDEFVKRIDEEYPTPNIYGDEYRRLIAYLHTVREAEIRRNIDKPQFE